MTPKLQYQALACRLGWLHQPNIDDFIRDETRTAREPMLG
jgi:hypothetical protein